MRWWWWEGDERLVSAVEWRGWVDRGVSEDAPRLRSLAVPPLDSLSAGAVWCLLTVPV